MEMETVAKNFEQEEGILEKVEQQMKCERELWMQNMIPSIKDEDSPYCEVKNTLVINRNLFLGCVKCCDITLHTHLHGLVSFISHIAPET